MMVVFVEGIGEGREAFDSGHAITGVFEKFGQFLCKNRFVFEQDEVNHWQSGKKI